MSIINIIGQIYTEFSLRYLIIYKVSLRYVNVCFFDLLLYGCCHPCFPHFSAKKLDLLKMCSYPRFHVAKITLRLHFLFLSMSENIHGWRDRTLKLDLLKMVPYPRFHVAKMSLRLHFLFLTMSQNIQGCRDDRTMECYQQRSYYIYSNVRPCVCLSVRQVWGETRFSRPLIKIEVRFLRASLLMDVVILVLCVIIKYHFVGFLIPELINKPPVSVCWYIPLSVGYKLPLYSFCLCYVIKYI